MVKLAAFIFLVWAAIKAGVWIAGWLRDRATWREYKRVWRIGAGIDVVPRAPMRLTARGLAFVLAVGTPTVGAMLLLVAALTH